MLARLPGSAMSWVKGWRSGTPTGWTISGRAGRSTRRPGGLQRAWLQRSPAATNRPAGWPEQMRRVVRPVRVERDEAKSDPRSRRRRTIDPSQLAPLEAGEAGSACAYSLVLTSLDGDVVEIEAWFRLRALVEETRQRTRSSRRLRATFCRDSPR